MGYALDKQLISNSNLSTGLISIGTPSDDPSGLITVNNALTITSATQVLTSRVNFEVLNHNLTNGQTFIPAGNTPAAYNGSFVVDNVVDSNNVEVILLSDPGGDATVVGTYDDGTLNIIFAGEYRIVDRINTANNRFYTPRSRRFNWVATSNKDHTAAGSDGNFLVIVDNTGTISIIQLASGVALLPIYSDTEPNLNTHVQLASLTKSANSIVAGTIDITQWVQNNASNKIHNIALLLGTVNSLDNPITTAPISLTTGISTTAGRAFLGSNAGFVQTGGLNPDQFTNFASSPTFILRALRDNTIDSQALTLDVNNFESSPGVLTSIGSSKAANQFIIAFGSFNAQIRGQQTFSGGSRLTDAANAGEDPDIPAIAIFGAKIDQYSINFAEIDLDNSIQRTLKQFR